MAIIFKTNKWTTMKITNIGKDMEKSLLVGMQMVQLLWKR
jgi:hypothetical protein